MRHWDFVSSCDLHLHLASTNNAAAYYLPLGHQTVRAPPEKKTATHKSLEGNKNYLERAVGQVCKIGTVVFVKMSQWLMLEWLGAMFAISIY